MSLRTAFVAIFVIELIVVFAAALVVGASPAFWGVALFLGVGLLVAARVRRHLSRTVLLGAPVVLGGAAAIALGASDYVPWLTSPALWLGIATSTLAGAWLVRSGRAGHGTWSRGSSSVSSCSGSAGSPCSWRCCSTCLSGRGHPGRSSRPPGGRSGPSSASRWTAPVTGSG